MITGQSLSKIPDKSFSDEALIAAIKKRDEQAIKYVYLNFWPMILQLVKVNSGNEEEARDLYQEGMLDFLEKVWNGKLVLTCKIKTFIYSICRNKWLYQLRLRQKFVDVDEYVVLEKPFQEEAEEVVRLPDNEQIKTAIISLGEPCYSLLIGFYYEGLSMEQLAVKMNYKSANVVKQQKFRCKDKLKQILTTF